MAWQEDKIEDIKGSFSELCTYWLLEDGLQVSRSLFVCTQHIHCMNFVCFSGQQWPHQECSTPCIVDANVVLSNTKC